MLLLSACSELMDACNACSQARTGQQARTVGYDVGRLVGNVDMSQLGQRVQDSHYAQGVDAQIQQPVLREWRLAFPERKLSTLYMHQFALRWEVV